MAVSTTVVVTAGTENDSLERFFGNVHGSKEEEEGLGEAEQRGLAGSASNVSKKEEHKHLPVWLPHTPPACLGLGPHVDAHAHRIKHDQVAYGREAAPAAALALDPETDAQHALNDAEPTQGLSLRILLAGGKGRQRGRSRGCELDRHGFGSIGGGGSACR